MQKVVLTWAVRSAIATVLVWAWMAWQGWPAWLWAALPVYIVLSLILSLIMNKILHRKIETLKQLVEEPDFHDDP